MSTTYCPICDEEIDRTLIYPHAKWTHGFTNVRDEDYHSDIICIWGT